MNFVPMAQGGKCISNALRCVFEHVLCHDFGSQMENKAN